MAEITHSDYDRRDVICIDAGRSTCDAFANGNAFERVDVDTREPVGGTSAVGCEVPSITRSDVLVY